MPWISGRKRSFQVSAIRAGGMEADAGPGTNSRAAPAWTNYVQRQLEPDCQGHVRPGPVRLSLESPEVDARDRERAVVEEGAHRLD
jgi:hypothetical protein